MPHDEPDTSTERQRRGFDTFGGGSIDLDDDEPDTSTERQREESDRFGTRTGGTGTSTERQREGFDTFGTRGGDDDRDRDRDRDRGGGGGGSTSSGDGRTSGPDVDDGGTTDISTPPVQEKQNAREGNPRIEVEGGVSGDVDRQAREFLERNYLDDEYGTGDVVFRTDPETGRTIITLRKESTRREAVEDVLASAGGGFDERDVVIEETADGRVRARLSDRAIHRELTERAAARRSPRAGTGGTEGAFQFGGGSAAANAGIAALVNHRPGYGGTESELMGPGADLSAGLGTLDVGVTGADEPPAGLVDRDRGPVEGTPGPSMDEPFGFRSDYLRSSRPAGVPSRSRGIEAGVVAYLEGRLGVDAPGEGRLADQLEQLGGRAADAAPGIAAIATGAIGGTAAALGPVTAGPDPARTPGRAVGVGRGTVGLALLPLALPGIFGYERQAIERSLQGTGPEARAAGQTIGSILGGPVGGSIGYALAPAYRPGEESEAGAVAAETGALAAAAGSAYAIHSARRPGEAQGELAALAAAPYALEGGAAALGASRVPTPSLQTFALSETRGLSFGFRRGVGKVEYNRPLLTVARGTPGRTPFEIGTPRISLRSIESGPGAELSALETRALGRALSDVDEAAATRLESFRGTQRYTQRSNLQPRELEPVIGDVLETHGVPREAAPAVLETVRAEGGSIYGSITQRAAAREVGEPGINRVPRDIDVGDVASKLEFGETVTQRINAIAGRRVVTLDEGTPTSIASGEKLFDIHEAGAASGGAATGRRPFWFGIRKEPNVLSEEGIATTRLTEQTARKGKALMERATADPRRTGFLESALTPEHGGRLKDIPDFYMGELANIESLRLRGRVQLAQGHVLRASREYRTASRAETQLDRWLESFGPDVAAWARAESEAAQATGGLRAQLADFAGGTVEIGSRGRRPSASLAAELEAYDLGARSARSPRPSASAPSTPRGPTTSSILGSDFESSVTAYASLASTSFGAIDVSRALEVSPAPTSRSSSTSASRPTGPTPSGISIVDEPSEPTRSPSPPIRIVSTPGSPSGGGSPGSPGPGPSSPSPSPGGPSEPIFPGSPYGPGGPSSPSPPIDYPSVSSYPPHGAPKSFDEWGQLITNPVKTASELFGGTERGSGRARGRPMMDLADLEGYLDQPSGRPSRGGGLGSLLALEAELYGEDPGEGASGLDTALKGYMGGGGRGGGGGVDAALAGYDAAFDFNFDFDFDWGY